MVIEKLLHNLLVGFLHWPIGVFWHEFSVYFFPALQEYCIMPDIYMKIHIFILEIKSNFRQFTFYFINTGFSLIRFKNYENTWVRFHICWPGYVSELLIPKISLQVEYCAKVVQYRFSVYRFAIRNIIIDHYPFPNSMLLRFYYLFYTYSSKNSMGIFIHEFLFY